MAAPISATKAEFLTIPIYPDYNNKSECRSRDVWGAGSNQGSKRQIQEGKEKANKGEEGSQQKGRRI